MSTYTVSNTIEFKSALTKASGGDTIILADGDYGDLKISTDYAAGVTIQAANDLGASFGTVQITGSNIKLDGLTINGRFTIDNAQNIEVAGCKGTSWSEVQYSSNIVIQGNDFATLQIMDTNSFVIKDNYIHEYEGDLLRVVGNSYDGVIKDNTLWDAIPTTGDHPDCLQMFSMASGTPHDIVIRGNLVYDNISTGDLYTQGIFLGGPTGGYKNIIIEENLISTSSPNAIYISTGVNGNIIRNNTVLNSGLIQAKTGSSGTEIYNNVVKQIVAEDGAQAYDNYFYTDASALFQNSGDGSGWQGFLPQSGSAIDFGSGYGALERLNELLDGDSDSSISSSGGSVSGGGNTPTDPGDGTDSSNISGNGDTDTHGTENLNPTDPDTDASGSTEPSSTIDDAALSLDGDHEFANAADVIEIAPDAALALDAGTISLSFNADSVSGKHGIITKDAYGYGDHFAAYIQDGTLKVRFQHGDGETFINVTGIKANTDYDLQVSFGDGDATVWLNGQKVDEVDTNMSWEGNGEYLQIGANGWASKSGEAGFGDLFDGTISDVLVVGGEYDPAGLDTLANAAPEPEPEPEAPTENGNTGDNGDVDLPRLVFSLLGDNEFNGSRRGAFNQAHDAALELEEGTIAFSFNADKVSGKQGLISKDAYGYAGGGNHFTAWIHNGDLKIRFQDGEDDAEFVFENLKANTDYDVQAYFDGDTVGVLVDGKSIGEQAFDIDLTTNREYLQAGGMGWASETGDDEVNNGYDGTLTDVMIFDTAISQAMDAIA